MRLEKIIFSSRMWNSIKGRIPTIVRSTMSSGLLRLKRAHFALVCYLSLPKYVTNPFGVFLKELTVPKGGNIEYHLRNGLGLTIRAKTFDKYIVQEIYTGSYDIALSELPKSPVVIDAGAHIGVFATKVTKDYPLAVLFCIEPIADNLRLLNKNLKDNSLSTMTAIIDGSLSGSSGQKTIYGRKDHSAGFNLYMPTDMEYKTSGHTLESLFQEYKIAHCDLLKLDIEGGEYEVLYSTPLHIFEKIENIVMEYHPFPKELAGVDKLVDFLSKNNYSVNLYSNKMLYATRGVK